MTSSSPGKFTYADIYVDTPLGNRLTYRVPEDITVMPGMRVIVNLGSSARGGREMTGWVVDVHNRKPEGGFKIKDIIKTIDTEPLFDQRLVSLCLEISDYYVSTPEEAMSTALPSGKKVSSRQRIKHKAEDIPPLTDAQSEILKKIMKLISSGVKSHLLHGVTGSGKTDIYIALARKYISEGYSVIYMVPEISLSSQIFQRLSRAFGDNLVLYHSGLSPGERLDSWKRFYSGSAGIAVGTRSSVFMQCPSPGLIIVDEEHDSSYKENSSPRYNARRVALMRSAAEGPAVIFGSATPSIESYYAAERGVLALHTLSERYGDAVLPQIEIVRLESGSHNRILSTPLRLHTMRALKAGKQALFLLNRRGFSPFLLCTSCGWKSECGDCGISMNYHRGGTMVCHYCGIKDPAPDKCPKCSSEDLEKIGSGTQRVEEMIDKAFSGYKVVRLDRDSSRKKGMVENLIAGMNSGEIDILVGTQLVAKGFDFPGVTVAGIIMAEIGLNIPDFRASERIFSLLTQASGRAGRGSDEGIVVIQTLDEDNPLFHFLKKDDYKGFYNYELSVRRAAGYPPFKRLVRILVRGGDRDKVTAAAESAYENLSDFIRKNRIKDLQILGPAAAPFEKVGPNYRYHLLIKTTNPEPLKGILRIIKKEHSRSGQYVEIDIDPVDIM